MAFVVLAISVGLYINLSTNEQRPMYISYTLGDDIPEVYKNYKLVNTVGLESDWEQIVDDSIKGDKKMALEEGGVCEYVDSKFYLKGENESEYGDFYAVYDVYEDESGTISMEYIRGNGYLSKYSNHTEDLYKAAMGNVTIEEAQQIAEDFIEAQTNSLAEYTFDSAYVGSDDVYNIHFTRYINGYATDDTIYMRVAKTGNIRCYKATNYRKYEQLEDFLVDKKLIETKEILIEQLKLDENNVISDEIFTIVTNESGDVYMRAKLTNNPGSYVTYIYTQVK